MIFPPVPQYWKFVCVWEVGVYLPHNPAGNQANKLCVDTLKWQETDTSDPPAGWETGSRHCHITVERKLVLPRWFTLLRQQVTSTWSWQLQLFLPRDSPHELFSLSSSLTTPSYKLFNVFWDVSPTQGETCESTLWHDVLKCTAAFWWNWGGSYLDPRFILQVLLDSMRFN